ncbi:hypothetical protein DFA_00024 [Cavenderia fasciculata]|uniref:amidophosphoribosyltransferase n=1 Tax=Cavenderia fasciculata TaxID=261658 RepID=F4PXD7_CACFS|nr:uncharacterized protein DFA_00024 [Cavenderia fasciculata]EGG19447.1 hypothetical protein DFA_00024 [Cavenderia fasciculata]|eukprot:XP_004357741.1 hypothetical protein DFA_00024 [Cavenderia fasciculata]
MKDKEDIELDINGNIITASEHQQIEDDEPKEKCGVFGIYAPELDVSRIAFFALVALQHRGQESCGIATYDQHHAVHVETGMGLVNQVFTETNLKPLRGNMGIGHTRYSTAGKSTINNAQPVIVQTLHGQVGIVQNGNLTTAHSLRSELLQQGIGFFKETDVEIITQLLAANPPAIIPTSPLLGSANGNGVHSSGSSTPSTTTKSQPNWEQRIANFMSKAEGAYSLCLMTPTALYGVRDYLGLRPLCIGALDVPSTSDPTKTITRYVIASESCAINTIGGRYIREVRPGEIVRIDDNGLDSFIGRTPADKPALCVFEYVYFSRPDSLLEDQLIHSVRQRMGEQLARESPPPPASQANKDLETIVIGVPDSSLPAAIGYAKQSGLAYTEGLTKNRYIHRTFIQPSDHLRQQGIKLKFNPLSENIKGRRVVLVDDSIVRGNTIKNAGAVEIHVRISSPPVMHPCYMGIDMATHDQLVGYQKTTKQVCDYIGAESLEYLSYPGMMKSVNIGLLDKQQQQQQQQNGKLLCDNEKELEDGSRHCSACFSGVYPLAKSKCGIVCDIIFPIIVVSLLLALISLLSIIEFDYDQYEILTLENYVYDINRTRVLYGPSPLTPTSQKILDSLKNDIINGSNGLLPMQYVDQLFVAFKTESEMESYYANFSESAPYGLWFNNDQLSSTTPFSYSIRYDQDRLPANDGHLKEDFSTSAVFAERGICSLQLSLDQAIIRELGGRTSQSISVYHRLFPNPHDQAYQKVRLGRDLIHKSAGGIFITAALLIYAYRLITDLVVEKETKIKEGMTMMGMSSAAYYLSWNITSIYIGLPVTVVLWLIFKISNIIHFGNWGLVLLLFVFYFFTLLLIGNLLSLFFDRSKFAGIISYGFVVGLSVAGYYVAKAEMTQKAKLALSLISPFGFQCAIFSMAQKDLDGIDPNPDYFPQLGHIVGMLFIDILLYVLILWYLDKVVPSEYGVKEPFYFFLMPSYWRKGGKRFDDPESNALNNYADQDVELIPVDLRNKVTVSIRGLKKDFNTGNGLRTAVDGLNLEMYQDQIHAFLGHNGAGKSTTIGMLTGLIKPTSGDALIQGNSISREMNRVRNVIGVCPQQDIIWKELTVFEHLSIYAALKGVPANLIDKQAEEMAREIGLADKIHAPSGTMSGGQKRKLCLGIAFIGRSEVIFLDEVTSGMDPLSRRGVWDFLLRHKKTRTIVLTTHFMDEADFLGDRIAIISHGKLRCDGSPLYLKKKFGIGYLLTMSKIEGQCRSQDVINFVQSYIPEAAVLSDVGTELSIRLPTSSSNQFVPLFIQLDQQKGYLGVGHYGISITTMEEVFLRIGQESDGGARQFNLTSNNNNNNNKAINTNAVARTAKQQLYGLLIKRIRTSIKDARGFFLSILLPAVVIFASIIIYKSVSGGESNSTLHSLPLSMSIYPPSQDFFIPYQTADNQSATTSFLGTSPFISQLTGPITSDFEDYLRDNFTRDPGALHFSTLLSASASSTLNYTALYNINYKQTLPALINMVSDSLLRSSPNANGAGIAATYKPFKHVLTLFEKQSDQVQTQTIVFFSLLFLAGYALMGASFAGNVCQERAYNIKRLLYISGCKKHVYWLSNLLWDYFFAAILVMVVTITMVCIDERFRDQWAIVLIAQVLYCIGIIPLSYLFSYNFKTHGKATGAIFGLLYTIGIVFFITSMNVRVQAASRQSTNLQNIGDILDYIFYAISPLYCLANTMLFLAKFPGTARVGQFEVDDFWSLHACGLPLIYLAVHVIVWLVWLFVLDMMPEIKGRLRNPRNVRAPTPEHDEDSDVANERLRIRSLENGGGGGSAGPEDLVVVRGLHKLFKASGKNKDKIAVHNSTFGIPRGQTFGLLGLNGAGKTTTLSMLSGDIYPTSGSASISGHDLITERSGALQSIGSCPQFDALIPLLTAREQLTLYARIKGIPEHQIQETVEAFISMMDVSGIANSNVGGYSGGNKRKISLSIAMLGNPSVVFLDEASTGCDPQVRRFMWNVITELGKNKVIIITTHSMEECEALCQRVSIMKDGKLTCLGSIQHIKSKFGSGYSIDIKFKKEYVDTGVDIVLRSFPGSSLLDRHDLVANFELPNPPQRPVKLCTIFQILQSQLHYLMDDYSVSQSTLDSIFIKLTASTHADRLATLSEHQYEYYDQSSSDTESVSKMMLIDKYINNNNNHTILN